MNSRIVTAAIVVIVTMNGLEPSARGQAINEARVDSLFDSWDRKTTPGASIAIIRDGDVVYSRGFGMANLEHNIRNTPETIFRIGSTSKQFTAACIALLAIEGSLSLDDDIRKWIPEIPAYSTPITVSHLIHHTSGLRDYLELFYLSGRGDSDYYTAEETIQMLARQGALNFQPGAKHLYSNSGYFLLGQIVERVSGKSLREFADERLFGPLQMSDTHFNDDHTEIIPARASGYARTGDGYRINMTALDLVGDGGVFTTVSDLARWDANFYDPIVGGPELIDLMRKTGALNDGTALDYAFGLVAGEFQGIPIESHGGAFVGFRAQMIRFPEHRFSVICLANTPAVSPGKRCEEIASIYLSNVLQQNENGLLTDDSPGSAEPTPTKAKIGRFEGTYKASDGSATLRLRASAGNLDGDLSYRGQEDSIPLLAQPTGAETFKAIEGSDAMTLVFSFDEDGVPANVTVTSETGDPIIMHFTGRSDFSQKKLSLNADDQDFIQISLDDIKPFTGQYATRDRSARCVISNEKKKLLGRIFYRGQGDPILFRAKAIGENKFHGVTSTDTLSIEFVRQDDDPAEQVTITSETGDPLIFFRSHGRGGNASSEAEEGGAQAASLSEKELGLLTGAYETDDKSVSCRIAVGRNGCVGELTYHYGGNDADDLAIDFAGRPTDSNTLVTTGGKDRMTLSFDNVSGKRPDNLKITSQTGDIVAMKRVAGPDTVDLAHYADRWESPELDVTTELQVLDGALYYHCGHLVLGPFTAVDDTLLFSSGTFLDFTLDGNGKAVEFELGLSRAQGIVFHRL